VAVFSPVTLVGARYAAGGKGTLYRPKDYIAFARQKETAAVRVQNISGGQNCLFLV
jgi:hypothetical protein